MAEESLPDPASGQITSLLVDWSRGDQESMQELMSAVYEPLRRMASSYLSGERSGHTLDTSSLVHEAYLKLVDQNRVRWRDRAHFFAIAGHLMRRILVDHARRRATSKRGGAVERVPLIESFDLPIESEPELLALDEALDCLAQSDAESARLVELRYFGGLTKEETAEVLGISSATVIRRWRMIRAWLHSYLVRGERHEI